MPFPFGGILGFGGQFRIASVSRCGGKAAGGTALSVTGSGFVAGMTALLVGGGTFGTVSAITSTSCTVTTAAGSGAVKWTLHTPGGANSVQQSFAYLAAPTLVSLTPSTGPATLSTSGIAVQCTNLPDPSWNVPVTGVVGSGTLSAINITSASLMTATTSAPGAGAQTAKVTVDGVDSNTLASAFTGTPAPSISAVGSMSTSGGTCSVSGAAFVSGITATVLISGVSTPLTVVFNSSTSITITLAAGTYAAGNWDLTLQNLDLQNVTEPGGLFLTAISTPATLLTTSLRLDLDPDHGVTVAAGLATAVVDQSGNGNNLTTHTALAYTANDDPTGTHATLTFDGATSFAAISALSLGSPTAFGFMAVVKETGANATNRMLHYGSCTADLNSTGKFVLSGAGAAVITGIRTLSGGWHIISGTIPGGGGTKTIRGPTDGESPEPTNSGTVNGVSTGQVLGIFGSQSGTNLAAGKLARLIVWNADAGTSVDTQLATYMDQTYGVTSAPAQPSIVTKLPSAQSGTLGFRMNGAANSAVYIPGTTVTILNNGSVVSTTTATAVTTSILESTFAGPITAGVYDVRIDAPTGRSVTYLNQLTATATPDPQTTWMLDLRGWYLPDASLGFVDYSGMGHALTTSTALTYSASDAGANNQPSITFNGTTSVGKVSVFVMGATTGLPLLIHAVLKATSATGQQGVCSYQGPPTAANMRINAGTPRMLYGGAIADHGGGSIVGSGYRSLVGFGTNATTSSINVSNGTAVTASSSAGSVPASSELDIGSIGTGNFFAGSIASLVVVQNSAVPSAGQLTNAESYAHTTFSVP